MKIYIARDEQAEIAGTLSDLRRIHDSIQSLATSANTEVAIPAHSTADAEPWDECLSRLVIRKGNGKVNVNATPEDLVIAGDPEYFEAVASYFAFNDDEAFPEHHHLEYHPDHFVLRANALSLVIGFEDPDRE
jgi:hypothetical protein